jgi:hypothetical protein
MGIVACLLLLTGCAHGMLAMGGAEYMWPALDEDTDINGVQGMAGVGFAFEPDERFSNPLKRKEGLPTDYIEVWATYGDDFEGAEFTSAGVGYRAYLSDDRFFARLGGLFQHASEDGSKLNGGGVYAGFGYNFFLDSQRRVSISPGLLASFVVLGDSGDTENLFQASAGVSLVWRFTGDDDEDDDNDKDDD